MPGTIAILGFDGSHIDGSWYTAVTDLARSTGWLNAAMQAYSTFGIAVFVVLMVAAWWTARRAGGAVMAAALGVPAAAVVAYALNVAVKAVVAEPRPCFAYPHDFLLERCPPMSDYAFPSNHTAVAAAMTAALFLISWRIGALGAIATALMGFSRIYVGAHYPHDVAAALLVGAVAGLATALVIRRYASALIKALRAGPLHPLLIATGPTRRRATSSTHRRHALGDAHPGPAPASRPQPARPDLRLLPAPRPERPAGQRTPSRHRR